MQAEFTDAPHALAAREHDEAVLGPGPARWLEEWREARAGGAGGAAERAQLALQRCIVQVLVAHARRGESLMELGSLARDPNVQDLTRRLVVVQQQAGQGGGAGVSDERLSAKAFLKAIEAMPSVVSRVGTKVQLDE